MRNSDTTHTLHRCTYGWNLYIAWCAEADALEIVQIKLSEEHFCDPQMKTLLEQKEARLRSKVTKAFNEYYAHVQGCERCYIE